MGVMSFRRIAPFLLTALIKGVGATLRMRVVDQSRYLNDKNRRTCIFVLWHNRLFLTPFIRRKVFLDRNVMGLVSASKDGEMLARVMKSFQMGSARGSSSRKGASALREVHRGLETESDVAITPDGPRGPCYRVHPGAWKLSQLTGAPIVPISFNMKAFRLRSWDRFMVPIPFSKVEFIVGTPFIAAQEVSEEDGAKLIHAALMDITDDLV